MEQEYNGLEIAVIGVACRFPGAQNTAEFWENLSQGKESITFLSEEQLSRLKVNKSQINDPKYVNCIGGEFEGKNEFDPTFFNISAAEAAIMDPQTRVFLETAWHALEDAGCVTGDNNSIGVYASAKSSFFWQSKSFFTEEFSALGGFAASTLSNKDFLSTTISYKLNLTGPSVVLHSTCSSSLVAIHQACQALNCGECDMALAGGVNIVATENHGYIHQEGMIYSSDGHCRPFDKNATGTIEGEGVGAVLLKPLEDAIKDNDQIYAIVKGSAVNNDGSLKLGFTAPSIQGQQKVIKMAHLAAEVEPESIGYIEAHGTGTDIGDPIEVEALNLAFNTEKKNFCGIGAVKANVGHLDAAAGITGFIKTVLSLHHKKMLPATNFEAPNPKINFSDSPFYVNRDLKDWTSNEYPLRAGISSFGMGGTNAHAILEEAPEREESSESRKHSIIVLSAQTEGALERHFEQLKKYALTENKAANLSDIAYTLKLGRKAMKYRMAFSLTTLEQINTVPFRCEKVQDDSPQKVFMFPGQGSQYANMAKGLYESDSCFKEVLDECFDIIKGFSTNDFKSIMLGEGVNNIDNTEFAQPLLFITEYATAKLLMSFGIQADAFIGHSIGEYVAACLSGVFSLESVLKVVVTRGRLMQLMPKGAMISVNAKHKDLISLISEQIDIAVVNSHDITVLSGDFESIDACHVQLQNRGYNVMKLHTSHAFHSRMMDPMLDTFAEELRKLELNTPTFPFISNLTGKWITSNDATSVEYWVNQLRNTVRFSEGIDTLHASGFNHFIEVGPGTSLNSLVKRKGECKTFSTVRHVNKKVDDVEYLYNSIADMWMCNITLDWNKFYRGERRNKVSLPGYSFEKEKFWIEDGVVTNGLKSPRNKKEEFSKWFYAPVFKQNITTKEQTYAQSSMVLGGSELISQLNIENSINVEPGTNFEQVSPNKFSVNPVSKESYRTLLDHISDFPENIIYLFSYDSKNDQNQVFESALTLIQCLSERNIKKMVSISFVVCKLHDVLGNENITPDLSLLKGLTKVVPQEIVNLKVRMVDLDVLDSEVAKKELLNISFDNDLVVIRNERKWMLDWGKTEFLINKKEVLKQGGTYLITGGSGKIATAIANYLIQEYNANIISVSRQGVNDKIVSNNIKHIRASISDQRTLKNEIDKFEEEFGQINGVFHTAGLTTSAPVELTNETFYQQHFEAKVLGTKVIDELFASRKMDFVLLTSSLSAILGGLGYAAYASVNNFQDAYAKYAHSNRTPWFSINFDGWDFESAANSKIILPDEGLKAIETVLNSNIRHVAISTTDLAYRMKNWVNRDMDEDAKIIKRKASKRKRPDLPNIYKKPYTKAEKIIEEIINVYFNYESIGAEDSFFDLGGDSLMALSILSKIHERLKVRITIKEFYECPTIRELAALALKGDKSQYNHIKKAEKKEYYNTSSIQKRIYFASLLNKESVNYNLSSFYHIVDPISHEEIEGIFNHLVERHEALRTRFTVQGKQPVQIIGDLDPIELEVFQECKNSDDDVIKNNKDIIDTFIRPFDLGNSPLMRVGLIELKNNEKLLMLDFHHIISDAVSGNVILNEMVQLFKNESLEPVYVHYKDFSEWHQGLLHSDRLRQQRAYWAARLEGGLTYLKVPSDFERPKNGMQESETVYFDIDESHYKNMQTLMAATGSSLFILTLSAAYVLLHKYSGVNDILVGTETGGRPHSDLQNTIGMFVGLLPLRNNIQPNSSFKELLLEVKDRTLQDFDNQLYQFNDIVRDLNLKNNIETNPLFNIVVSLDNISTTFSAEAEESKKGVNAQKIEFRQKESIWDLRFGIVDTKGKIAVKLDYASRIYKRETCEAISERYVQIISQVVSNPDLLIQDIEFENTYKTVKSNTKMIEEVDFEF